MSTNNQLERLVKEKLLPVNKCFPLLVWISCQTHRSNLKVTVGVEICHECMFPLLLLSGHGTLLPYLLVSELWKIKLIDTGYILARTEPWDTFLSTHTRLLKLIKLADPFHQGFVIFPPLVYLSIDLNCATRILSSSSLNKLSEMKHPKKTLTND